MSDVTHGKCPRCNGFQPIVWRKVTIAECHPGGKQGNFEGMEAVCRNCDFSVATLGSVHTGRWDGASNGN